ncbi:MAG: hypothetical protein N3B01_09410, partial [Verrucomicrobiae bacterium]|nr:hypothetical protein [Verrucomicrobiae bacterium]
MTQTTHTQWRAKIKLTAIMVAAATSAEAGRPLTIDDAEPVPHRHFELEAGAWYACGSGLRHFHLPFVLAYGLLPRAEFGVGFGGQVQERTEELGEKKTVTDLGDLVLSTKAKVLTADRFR